MSRLSRNKNTSCYINLLNEIYDLKSLNKNRDELINNKDLELSELKLELSKVQNKCNDSEAGLGTL